MMPTKPRGESQPPPETAARVIYGALIAGVVLFAVVAGVITGWGERPMVASGADATTLAVVWLALTLATVPAVLLFRRRAARAAGIDQPYQDQAGAGDPQAAQVSLIIAWALVEGPAFLGIVMFLLYGMAEVLLGALLAGAIGWGLTYPKRAYFESTAG